jgi:hypothetical protein
VIVVGPCVEHQGRRNPKGYGQVFRQGKTWQAHRWAWAQAHGDPGSAYVLHHCDNPPCVNVDHLFLGTNADNMADMKAKDRQSKKLTTEQVEAIRADERPHGQIAADYGVCRSNVSMIKEGRRR